MGTLLHTLIQKTIIVMETPRFTTSNEVHHRISTGKLMLTFFFDHRGALLVQFICSADRTNQTSYTDTLMTLHNLIKRKRPGLLTRKVVFHHNARLHTSALPQGMIHTCKWDIVEQPPYSPDTWPYPIFIFLAY